MPAPGTSDELHPRILLALGAVTAAALAYQVLLTRVLSAVLAYHFSFLAVSLSLVGTGAGAMLVYLRPRSFTGPTGPYLSRWTEVFGAALVMLPIAIVQIDLAEVGRADWTIRFAAACALAAIPAFAAGVVVALALSRFSANVGAVYGADLVGAGVGAIVAVPAMWWLPAPELIVLAGMLVAVAAGAFDPRRPVVRVAAIPAVGAVVLLANPVAPLLELSSGYRIPPGARVVERWTPLSRVLGVTAAAGDPFAMVLYDRVYAPVPVVSAGSEPTWRELQTGLQSIPYRFAGPGHVLIIGGGGGRDIHTALSERQEPIDVIELNDGIRKVVDEDLADVSGSPYSLPGVRTAIGDGRSTLAGRAALYDQIHLGFTDTLSANAAQGFALMESNLYTIEAFQEYFDHLAPNGILAVSRLYDFVGPEVLRLTVLAMAALREHGVERPRDHLFVMRGTELGGAGMGTLLLRLEAFDARDLHRLRFLARLRGGEVVFAPDGAAAEGDWGELAAAGDELEFCRSHKLDVCPPTDDRPFFFNMDRTSIDQRTMASFWGGVTPFAILMKTLAILVGLSVIAFVLPLAVAPGRAPPPRHLAYFVAIGLGYILIEILLIQHFVLFLGFPTYALSVVLAGLLVFSGIGAFSSGRLSAAVPLAAALATAAVLTAIGAVALQPLLRSWIGYTLPARVTIALLVLAPIGIPLGMAMPLGLRRLELARPGCIPYAWGVNGIASVLASVLGVTIAMLYGFEVTGLVAAACYGIALIVALTTRVAGSREPKSG